MRLAQTGTCHRGWDGKGAPMLTEAEARAIIRMLGDVAALEGGLPEKKRFLMEGVSKLVSADAWVWTLACRIEPGGPQTYAGFMHGGFDDVRFAKFVEAVEHPVMAKAAERFFAEVARSKAQTTMLRADIDPDGLALVGEVSELWAAADIGPLVMSTCPLEDGSQSGVGFYRRLEGDPFSERDRFVIQMILEEVRGLHMMGWPEDRGATVPELSPRQRMVLNLLLEGMSRKEIAGHLEISENTVSGYTKEVFRHFGVNSHVELMRKFLGAN